jgi:hypothetical protein
VSERRRLVVTLLATLVAAPLLLVEIAPGADANPDAALTAYSQDAPAPARAVGTLSSDDLATTRLFSTLSVGDDLLAGAAAEPVVVEDADTPEETTTSTTSGSSVERLAPVVTTTTTPPPPPPPPPPPAPSSGPSAAQWAALRNCESGGNYSIVSGNGLYFGAYQFSQSTWNGVANSAGRSDLVGIQPNYAAPADQDSMALALYSMSGSSPWPHCGRHLR